MGVVAINFIEVGSLLFEVTKNFRLFQKIMKRLLRGSSSQSSQEKQAKEKEKAKVVLQGRKDPGLQCVMLMRNHQEMLL